MEHHKYQGEDIIDADIPSVLELNVVTNTIMKLLFIIFQSFFYGFRPLLTYPKPMNKWELLNLVAVFSCDFFIFYMWGFKAILYLLLSTLLGK